MAAAGEGGLKCRRYHLKLAAEAPEVHCAHAQETAAAPCAAENPLKAPQFDCQNYNDWCVAPGHSQAYPDCEATVAGNQGGGTGNSPVSGSMRCRTYHLSAARTDPATHCPHASADGGPVCTDEVLYGPTFSCRAYEDRCAYLPGYAAYDNCDAVVAANQEASAFDPLTGAGVVSDYSMKCRQYHLKIAGGRVTADKTSDTRQADALVHCAHAAPDGGAPCGGEQIERSSLVFPCSTYDATCSTQDNYKPYENCAKTVQDNSGTSGFNATDGSGTGKAGEMGCRTYHLGLAASRDTYSVTEKTAYALGDVVNHQPSVHCTHAAPDTSEGGNPCEDENPLRAADRGKRFPFRIT